MSNKPLSDAVRAGWRVVAYSVNDLGGTSVCHNVVLERQGQHKFLIVRKKMLGEGLVVEEMDV